MIGKGDAILGTIGKERIGQFEVQDTLFGSRSKTCSDNVIARVPCARIGPEGSFFKISGRRLPNKDSFSWVHRRSIAGVVEAQCHAARLPGSEIFGVKEVLQYQAISESGDKLIIAAAFLPYIEHIVVVILVQ